MKKNLIIISSILCVFLIIITFVIHKSNNEIVEDNSSVTIKNNPVVTVYEDVKVSDFIKKIDGKLAYDKKINTSKIGVTSVSFLYTKKDGKKRSSSFDVKVIDNVPPLIWLSNSYSINVGSDINLEENIMCADNYDTNLKCLIEGEYDANKIGDYKLTYKASDTSGNITSIPFTLHVIEKKSNNHEVTPVLFSSVVENYKNDDNFIGIDVSKWQKEIDWEKVKNSKAEFAMIRVGSQNGVDGEYVVDPYFKKNIEEALKQKIKVGVYFYSYAKNSKESSKQATWVLKQIKDYNVSLPVVFDWECYHLYNKMNLSLYKLNDIANSFLKTIENNNQKAMMYGSKNYLNKIWTWTTNHYDVWLAHYTSNTDYDKKHKMWQLTEVGKIDGMDEYVDINIMNY